jgi:hypothetical protein
VDYLPGRTAIQVRVTDDAEGNPERWTLFDVTEGTFREVAAGQFGTGWGQKTPPGSLEILKGPPLQIRLRESTQLPGSGNTQGFGGVERVIEWEPKTNEFVEKSRKPVTFVDKPGKRHSVVP